MKNRMTLRALVAVGMLLCGVAAYAATPPDPIEKRFTSTVSVTNNTGRAYVIEAIYVNAVALAGQTNAITVSVVNTQDTDTTGTNATLAAVQYDVLSITGTADSVFAPSTADEVLIVPAGAILKFTNATTATNDLLIIRDVAND